MTIEQISNEVEARITIQDANGTETRPPLHAPFWRCDQLAERIVFALQNIVDPLNLPQAETVATPNTPESHSDDAPQNEPTPSIEKTPRKPQRSSMIPKLGLSLAIGPAWWNAPETALSTSVGFELLWQRATVAIEGHYDYAWAVPQLPNYMAERTTVMIMGCARHHWSTRFMIRGCGFGDFGKTLFDNKKNHSQTPYAPVADVGARIALGVWFTTRFGIEARADAAYAAARPEVRLLDNRLWQMHPFTGALRLAFLGVFDVF
ncbi:MAG TPA: hypothetical protein PKA58_34220 [Polyangium sp.]|nr:hypothetical protein [Polyangium sp.]